MLEAWNWVLLIVEYKVGWRSLSGAQVRAWLGPWCLPFWRLRPTKYWDLPYFATSYKEASGLPPKTLIFFLPTYHCVLLEHVSHLLTNLLGATLDEVPSIVQQTIVWSLSGLLVAPEYHCRG